MTDLPPQEAPPQGGGAPLMPFDPDVEFEAQLIERYGPQAPQIGFANDVIGTVTEHDIRLGRHDRHLAGIDTWADGVNVFGEQQLALNATLTRTVTHGARRQDRVERHLGRSQMVDLAAAVILGFALVVFTLWVGNHDEIEGMKVNQTLAVWIAVALGLVFAAVALVILLGWFRPEPDPDPPVQQAAPEPPTERQPAQPAPPPPHAA